MMTRTSTKRRLKCQFCSRTFLFKKQLLCHQEFAHNKELPYACAKCQRAFSSAWDLNDHVMNHKEAVVCKDVSDSTSSFKRRVNHDSSKPPIITSVQHLCDQRVLRIILSKLPQQNPKEGKRTGLRNGYKSGPKSFFKHVEKKRGRRATVHPKVEETVHSFACTQCESKFIRSIQLKNHMLIHTEKNLQDRREQSLIDNLVAPDSVIKAEPCTVTSSAVTRSALTRCALKVHDSAQGTVYVTKGRTRTSSELSDTTIVSYGTSPGGEDMTEIDVKYSPPPLHNNPLNIKLEVKVEPRVNRTAPLTNGCKTQTNKTSFQKRPYKWKSGPRKFEKKVRREVDEKTLAHSCTRCDRRFVKSRQLETHMLTHVEKRVYPCSQCGEVFNRSAHYTTHFAEAHCGGGVVSDEGVVSYACPICNKSFNKMYYLNRHVKRSHTEAGVCLCTQCGKKFSTPHNLRSHETVHTGNLPFPCVQCGRRYSQAATMNRHIRRDHTVVRPFSCEQCGKTFVLAFDLKVHMGSHEKTHVCTQCGRKFGLRVQLKRHEVTHTNEKPFLCKKCGKRFALAWYRTAHMKVMHSNDSKITGERIYDCTQCPEKFDKFWDLNRHVRTVHSDSLPYVCSHCSRRFASKRRLKIHEAGHTGKLKCVCAECGKSYLNPSALKMHMMRSHSGERPHMCPLCGMSFITSGNLKQHEVVHTGARPYACTQCDRRFTQISTLNSHFKRTHVVNDVVNENISTQIVTKLLPFYLN